MRSLIATASKAKVGFARNIEADLQAGVTVANLVRQVALDRMALSSELKTLGDRLFTLAQREADVSLYRSSISRFYYSMFQVARAVVFITNDGDDKTSHQELPGELPRDLPNRAERVNDLKDVRTRRNNADYDPYPKDVDHWRDEALFVRAIVHDFVQDCVDYLEGRGIK